MKWLNLVIRAASLRNSAQAIFSSLDLAVALLDDGVDGVHLSDDSLEGTDVCAWNLTGDSHADEDAEIVQDMV